MTNKITLLFWIVFLTGCQSEKCVTVFDKNKMLGESIGVFFTSHLKLKKGALVTSWSPLYKKEMGMTDKQGNVCFKNHIEGDANYDYSIVLGWVFEKDEQIAYFNDFESIPDKVVLKKKISDKELDLFLNRVR